MLSCTKFFKFRPHLPFRYVVDFFTDGNVNSNNIGLFVSSVRLNAPDVDTSTAAFHFGDGYRTIPLVDPSAKTLEITFEETDTMQVLNFIDGIIKKQRFGLPYVLKIGVTEFNEKMSTPVKAMLYSCILSNYEEPSFSRTGGVSLVTLSATFNVMSEKPWTNLAIKDIKSSVGQQEMMVSDSADLLDTLASTIENTDVSPAISALEQWNAEFNNDLKRGLDKKPFGTEDNKYQDKRNLNNEKGIYERGNIKLEYNTEHIAPNVKKIDVTRYEKDGKQTGKQTMNMLGTNAGNVGDKFVQVEIHKVGFNSGGKYSEGAAAKSFASDGVAVIATGSDVFVSEDRMYGNFSSAAGGKAKSGKGSSAEDAGVIPIELGDKTLIGNSGAVIKKGDDYYVQLDYGVAGREWKKATDTELKEFMNAVGVSKIEDAFDTADSDINGTKFYKEKKDGLNLVTTGANGKFVEGGKLDYTGNEIEVLVPKLTQSQKTNLRTIAETIQTGYNDKNGSITVVGANYHGNVEGYEKNKIEGTKKQANEIFNMMNIAAQQTKYANMYGNLD